MPYTFEKPPELRDLQQVYSYLYRMSEELEGTLNNITAGDVKDLTTKVETAVQTATGGTAKTGQIAELQALIINTADTIESEMQRMEQSFEGSYLAKSDFGTRAQSFLNNEAKDATGTESLFGYIGQIDTVNKTFRTETSARIRTGLLYVDDNDVAHYGVAIGEEILDKKYTHEGQTVTGVDTSKTMSMFTSDRLEFWIGDSKVAYISNQELFVTRGRFLREIRIGRFAGVIDGTDPIVRWYVKEAD